jgi:glycosyltransferase involved in cell wall biosynthesis
MITIAVCIPTYRRPHLLVEAVASCLRQTLLPSEILIGDDSPDDDTEIAVNEVRRDSPVPIRYWHHRVGGDQGENINGLYRMVSSSHLALLHDDDVWMPNALAELAACWVKYPDLTAAYGKQHVISEDGTVCYEQSAELNRAFFRTSEFEGLQKFHWFPGVTQQFPNDGFVVTTDAARATLWRAHQEVGNGGEFDFGLRLCLTYMKFYFLNQYTVKYRLTTISNSNSRNDEVLWGYRILRDTVLPREAEDVRRGKLQAWAPQAIVQASYLGYKQESWSIYWGDYYPWNLRLSLEGFRGLAQTVLPGRIVRYLREKIALSRASKKITNREFDAGSGSSV